MSEILQNRPIVIAGPCAAESDTQIERSVQEAKKRDVRILRASIYKPRTRPSFDGLKEDGVHHLVDIANEGIVPATEVMNREQAEFVMNEIFKNTNSEVVIWLGSRNQNHQIQQEIGSLISGEDKVILGIKNQPWPDEDHTIGILDHVVHGGADPSQLFMIHRGFQPGTDDMRNKPDFPMAMRVKKATGVPMLIDPSHIGGKVNSVIRAAEIASWHSSNGEHFDGMMIEVHPNAENALTDSKQQLSWDIFDESIKDPINRMARSGEVFSARNTTVS